MDVGKNRNFASLPGVFSPLLSIFMTEKLIPNVTLGVSCKNNTQALLLCLSSVVTGLVVPRFIQVRLEGENIGLAQFYLEQILNLARLRGITTSISVAESKGTRAARDFHLEECETQYLWMVDDDVVAHADCLHAYMAVADDYHYSEQPAYYAGSKPDVANLRGYPKFSFKKQGVAAVKEGANHSLIYDIDDCFGTSCPCDGLDSGNVLLDIGKIREKDCKFSLFFESRNSSGDGTTFALAMHQKGLRGIFVPSAVVYHLEKEGGGFNELEARAEMLLRLCDLKGFDKTVLKRYCLPGTWKTD
jgi:hypothetical protein